MALRKDLFASRLLLNRLQNVQRFSTSPQLRSSDSQENLKKFEDIPGPLSLPWIGTRWYYFTGLYSFRRIHKTYEKIFRKYGYLVKDDMFKNRTIVYVYHPADIYTVYQATSKQVYRDSHKVIMKYRRERPELYDSAGLGPSNGEEWKKFRLAFRNAKHPLFSDAHLSNIASITDDLIERIKENLDKNGETDIKLLLFRWALENVGMVTMNMRLGAIDSVENWRMKKLIKAAHTTHDVIYQTENMRTISKRLYKKLVDAQDYSFEVINECIERSLADPKCKDSFVAENMGREDVSDKDVRTFVMDIFQGGMHSVPYSVSFALYHLARNPRTQDILRSRIIPKMPTQKAENINDDYLKGVIDETLRLNPPAIGTGRRTAKDISLQGYHIPSGTFLILQHQVASKLSEIYERPLEFHPHRTMNELPKGLKPLKKAEWSNFASKPFGYGQRACFGVSLAMKEMRIVIAAIVRNFKLSYHHKDIGTINRLHNEPDKPVMIRFKQIKE